MQNLMRQFGGGGAAATPPPPMPKKGEVCQISSNSQLSTIIKEYSGVIIDFWSPRCPPCMRFKPIFEANARANQNEKIAFCAVQTDENRDISMAFQVSSIPQFNFILNGEESDKFVGADENKFSAALAKLQQVLNSKSSEHGHMSFTQFKPMNKKPTSFAATGQMDKMKQFIKNFATTQSAEVASTSNVMQWIEASFDIEAIPTQAIDELVELAEVAEDKNKIALIDLFRLLVLKDSQAEYIVSRHWELIEVCVIGYLSAMDLSDESAKVMQNYH